MKFLSTITNSKKFEFFRMKSIKTRMVVFFSILIALSISFFGLIDFNNFSKIYYNDNINYTKAIASQVTLNLDTYLQEAETTIKVLSVNNQVISTIKNYSKNSDYDNFNNCENLNKSLFDIIVQKPDINNIIIYKNDIIFGNTIDISKKTNTGFLLDIQNIYKVSHISTVHFFKNYISKSYDDDNDISSRISVAYPIMDLENYNKLNLGCIVFDFNLSRIDEMFKNFKLNKNSIALISDVSGNIIYSNNEGFFKNNFDWGLLSNVYKSSSNAYTRKIRNNNMLITFSTSSVNNWKVVFIIDTSELDKNLSKTKLFSVFLIIICIIITVIISTILSIKNTTPLIKLVKKMRLVGQGNLDIRVNELNKGYDEINTLNNGFNTMMDRINQLIKEVYQTRLKQREAEFEALQAKINPHFLYNTLQTINSLAILERTKDIEQVSTSLGNLLEYLVYEQNEMVKVYQEIDYIKSYLEIQSTRFNNNFKVHIDLESEVNSCYILKLLLQPIIENAILHGLNKERENGLLLITGKLNEGNIIFEITDNGSGMDKPTLELVIKKLEFDENNNFKKSIGLKNVQERIKIKFGEIYGIRIDSILNEGTKVIMTIPAIFSKKEDLLDD